MANDDYLDAVTFAMTMIGDKLISVDMIGGIEMNVVDLSVALQFLSSNDDCKFIVLQCRTAKDIPYVKRALIHTLGEPRKIIDNSFYYEDKCIIMQSYTRDVHGYHPNQVFYIPYKSGVDWNEVCTEMGKRQQLVPYMAVPWLNEVDIYNMLVADGMSGDTALHIMSCDGLI